MNKISAEDSCYYTQFNTEV